MMSLTVGDPVPWFMLPSTSNPTFHFDTVGGYYVVLFFFGSSKYYKAAVPLRDFCQRQTQFLTLKIPFFGISVDSDDAALAELVEHPSHFKLMWDFEAEVSRQYGVCQLQGETISYQPITLVLDPTLRVLQIFPIQNPSEHVNQVMQFLETLPAPEPHQMAARQAPVLLIPRVFEPEFCRHLIQLFDADGGEESGFMREKEGKTISVTDYSFKKRRDLNLADTHPDLLPTINELVIRRVQPEIEKAFQFSITRFERHVVACYDGKTGGFFNRHRDNTTKGTAHRRFAMTINLNTGDYEGGCLWFPEYGTRLYRPGVGEAVIFSCSLLHEATPVLSGRRFALLSFFYNDEDAELRERNRKFLAVEPKPDRAAAPETINLTPAHLSPHSSLSSGNPPAAAVARASGAAQANPKAAGFQSKSPQPKAKGFQSKSKSKKKR
ncbi:redoxin domain-containing protein [Leptolyngbya sp. NK1-12]|uniref:Redoxin domain-containing protein n=1 Tax=Leptolyngbya sp. NK1-12 TaxID=2547451 RepID=A0AA96WLW6_9CYAN|nr:redoxin domain-containing protein [Leptolyngbya sp. NK1-12]